MQKSQLRRLIRMQHVLRLREARYCTWQPRLAKLFALPKGDTLETRNAKKTGSGERNINGRI
jgi:hypothetical protein